MRNNNNQPTATQILAIANLGLTFAFGFGITILNEIVEAPKPAVLVVGTSHLGPDSKVADPGTLYSFEIANRKDLVSRGYDRTAGLKQQDAANVAEVKQSSQKSQLQDIENEAKRSKIISLLEPLIGKTPYVWSGSTPAGWDCSGLTYWVYKQIGISVPRVSTDQKQAGTITRDPQPGDIVVFGWSHTSRAQHVGIYIGNGKMIHAGGRAGYRTEYESVDRWAAMNHNTRVTYVSYI